MHTIMKIYNLIITINVMIIHQYITFANKELKPHINDTIEELLYIYILQSLKSCLIFYFLEAERK